MDHYLRAEKARRGRTSFAVTKAISIEGTTAAALVRSLVSDSGVTFISLKMKRGRWWKSIEVEVR